MWRLFRSELRYLRGTWAAAYGLAALIGGSLLVALLSDSSSDREDSAAFLLLILFVPYAVTVASYVRQSREEEHLRLQLLLPLTVHEVGAARLLVAVAVWLAGLAFGGVVMGAARFAGFAPVSAGGFLTLNIMIFIFIQAKYLAEEGAVRSTAARFFWAALLMFCLIFLLMLPPPADNHPEPFRYAWDRLLDSPLRLLALYLLAPAAAALNLWLFTRRKRWLN